MIHEGFIGRRWRPLDPSGDGAEITLLLPLASASAAQQGIEELETAVRLGWTAALMTLLAQGYVAAGRWAEAEDLRAQLRRQVEAGQTSPYFLAGIYARAAPGRRSARRARARPRRASLGDVADLGRARPRPAAPAPRFQELLQRMSFPPRPAAG